MSNLQRFVEALENYGDHCAIVERESYNTMSDDYKEALTDSHIAMSEVIALYVFLEGELDGEDESGGGSGGPYRPNENLAREQQNVGMDHQGNLGGGGVESVLYAWWPLVPDRPSTRG